MSNEVFWLVLLFALPKNSRTLRPLALFALITVMSDLSLRLATHTVLPAHQLYAILESDAGRDEK
jgi:hypothetical protein